MTSGDGDIVLGTSLEGSHTLQLIAGTGNVELEAGNIDGLTVTSSATTDIAGIMVVDGNISVDATDTINVNGVVNSTSGSIGLTVTDTDDDNVATINVAANVIGDNVTITAVDANSTSEQINITSTLNNNRGGYTFEANDGTLDIDSNIIASDFIALNGGTAINLAANLTAVNDINVNDALTLDGGAATRTIESTSGDVVFILNSTINDDGFSDHSLIVNAASGLVDFNDTVGDTETPFNLTVAAQNVEFNNDVTVDNDLILNNSENVLLATGPIVLTATAGDILFNPAGQLDGAQDLQVVAGGDATFGTIGASTPLTGLDVDVTGTTTLNNDITVAGGIDFSDSDNVDLSGNVSITSTAAGDILLTGAALDGAYDLAVTNMDGNIWFDEVGQYIPLDSLSANTQNGDVNIFDTMTVTDLINIDAGGTIDIQGDIESVSGAITLTGLDIEIDGGLTLESFSNFTITGAVDLEQDATLTSINGNLTIANAITGSTPGVIILNATEGALAINDITGVTSLDVNASTATLNGTTITTAGTINFDDTGTTNLATNVVMTSGDGDIDLGTSLEGSHTLQLVAGTGNVDLEAGNIDGLTVTSSATTDITGAMVVDGDVSITATGEIDIANTGSLTTTGIGTTTLVSTNGPIDINGAVSSAGNLSMTTTGGNIEIDANVETAGDSTLTLASTNNNVNISQDEDAAVTSVNGKIDINAGASVLLGSTGNTGQIVTIGTGDVEITAATAFTMDAEPGTIVNSGGKITIDPATVTIDASGLLAVGDISVTATDTIDVNGPVNSTLAGNITMTAGNDILLSDEVRTTSTGDITLTATNGVIDDDDAGTEDEYLAGDVLTMTAANGIGITTSDIDTQANTITANTTGGGAASIAIENINSQTTILGVVAGGLNNTVGTNADFTFQQTGGGGLVVKKVFTTDGGIRIDSVGATAEPGIRVDFATTHAAPNNAGGIDAGGLTNGTVTLNTDGGGMVLGSVLGDNTINITADIGDIAIDVVGDSSNVDVNITSTSGYIDELVETGVIEDPDVDITGDEVTLSSAIGIGKKYELEIDAVTLNAETSSSSGNVVISELNDVILKNVSTVDGYIDITAGGYIAVENISANGIGRDVTLHSTGGLGVGHQDIVLNTVLADDDITVTADTGNIYVGTVGDAGTDDITMTATLGSIVELDNQLLYPGRTDRFADAAIDVTGDLLTLTAAGDIGGAGELDIETDITTLVADSTTAGNIYLTELDTGSRDGIELQSIDTNDGDITLITNGGKHEPEIETSVIDVRSDTGGANGHSISITAQTGDITLEYVSTDDDTGANGDVTLAATNGSITEIDRRLRPADTDVDIIADTLTITAQDEIGSTTGELDIETTVASLNALTINVGSGDIVITETDAINLVDVDVADGSVIVVAGGQITATAVDSTTDDDTNDISLTSTGAGIQAIHINAGALGDVTLDAQGGAITQDGFAAVDVTADVLTADALGGIDLDTTVNTLDADANAAGIVTINETDTIILANVTTTDGSITVNAGDNMTVTSVTAGGDTGSDDDVFLTTTAGDIIQSGDITALNDMVTLTSARDITDTTDPTTDISAADLILNVPAGKVGAPGINNQLDTDVDTITAAVNGDVYILEKDAVGLTSVVTTAGLVDVEAGGTITTTTVTANGGYAVNLNSTGGNIFDTAGGLITGTAKSSLKASGIVGTTDNPVDVDIDGDLWVWGGSEQNQVSVILDGTVNSTARTERVEIFEPSPPGLVILNNHLMGGGNYGSGSTEGSILSRGYGETIIAQANVLNLFYARTLQPWGSKISLPYLPSEISIIGDEFLNGPVAVIDGSQIGIKVMPTGLFITPARFQPENYYIIRTR